MQKQYLDVCISNEEDARDEDCFFQKYDLHIIDRVEGSGRIQIQKIPTSFLSGRGTQYDRQLRSSA